MIDVHDEKEEKLRRTTAYADGFRATPVLLRIML